MRYHLWYEALDDTTRIMCVDEVGGRLFDERWSFAAAAQRLESIIAGMHADDRSNVVEYHGDAPTAAALKLWGAADADEDDPRHARAYMQSVRDETHVCGGCIVRQACAVGVATAAASRMLPIVSACLGFQQDEGDA